MNYIEDLLLKIVYGTTHYHEHLELLDKGVAHFVGVSNSIQRENTNLENLWSA